MVQGIEKFKEYFKDYSGQYVFIGGTACDIILAEYGENFRATKDLDVVLILEALQKEFVKTFIDFVKKGGYEHINKGTGKNQFYRFSRPQNDSYPYMIELFSKKPSYLKSLESNLTSIHVSDDVNSLSAILLDDEYYFLLKSGRTIIDGVSVLNLESIILFKIKAWLDLSKRKEEGEAIDRKNIKKHKNDIFRLVANLDNEVRLNVTQPIKSDIELFLQSMHNEPIELKKLGIRNTQFEDVLEVIKKCYCLE